uniref:hypothetical protein n=1 Tax=Microbulbifer agarilyticus TaxID=260552 RepID=UPI0011101A5D|nr:hypothetical protein [Microbulbifer agarilyticus]
MRTRIVLLFLLITVPFKVLSGELINPKNMDELQTEISKSPNNNRSFYIEFPYLFSTDQVEELVSTYNLFPLDLSGTYDVKGETRYFAIHDFTQVDGNLKLGIKKAFGRHNKRASNRKNSGKIKKYELSDGTESVNNSGSVNIRWVRIKALGTYRSINQIVGSPNSLRITFTTKNIGPQFDEYLETLKSSR